MINFKEISKESGTPVYVLDKDRIKQNVEKIKSSVSYSNFQIHYAMFCNDNKELLEFIKKIGLGVLCLNEKEIKIALNTGFLKEQIHITGGTFTLEQLKKLAEYQIPINLDSLKQLELLGKIKPESEVGIRIRLSDAKGAGEGIKLEEVSKALEIANKHKLRIVGIQTYIGTNTLDEEKYLGTAKILVNLAKDFPGLSYINIGGGFGIPYSSKDKEFSWDYFGKEISMLFSNLCKNIQLKIEPGRSIVGDAGYFLTKVIEVRDKDTLVVDSPYTLFSRPFVYHTNHRVKVIGKEGNTKIFRIRGCSINSKDYLSSPDFEGDPANLPESIGESDLLCFMDVGAYSYPMQMDFLNYDKSKMILI